MCDVGVFGGVPPVGVSMAVSRGGGVLVEVGYRVPQDSRGDKNGGWWRRNKVRTRSDAPHPSCHAWPSSFAHHMSSHPLGTALTVLVFKVHPSAALAACHHTLATDGGWRMAGRGQCWACNN